MEEYEKRSEAYQDQVRESNKQKMELRDEISNLESEIRRLREVYADKEIENTNLKYLLSKEEELAYEKADLEEKSLELL